MLEQLAAGQRIEGVIPGEPVELISVTMHGPDSAQIVFRKPDGSLSEQLLERARADGLNLVDALARPFDADPTEFKLVAEARRIQLAGLFDPMLAVTTSDIQPLPHQIKAVYGELLPRTPLRYLLADDPGAGKTIMAGLYVKELILREDVHRCLIVAPGGLVEQWQDELYLKFGLRFEIFSTESAESAFGKSAFEERPLLIARMDQIARNEDLVADLRGTEWDLVVVDEAHRMSAHYYGNELKRSKRFQLGEELGRIARHLLLMTATPHAGKADDFQLFLSLLDRDRFEGRASGAAGTVDTKDVMRRMVKEALLTFEGKPLFPERRAETVPFELSEGERDLYEEVTAYVREGMNRAAKLDDKRRNTVGFALTVLQRRLASSPEAILRSLMRRSERLELWKQRLLNGEGVEKSIDEALGDQGFEDIDDDEFSAAESEELEEELVDAATAARTVEELDVELADLERLIAQARIVRASESDRKWSELRTIIEDETLKSDDGTPRKLIIFTEHRDTLEYLRARITTLLGRSDAVEMIHGGVRRSERRRITAEFTHNKDCHILLATDAAGEGLNLQAAHLMVNYDLPWNPNRIEQRFGRIHRIGQHEVCRLWNLVASDTREGDVFELLLRKVEEQRKAYGGKVFDVLGAAFEGQPLRELLLEAIRYGEKPEVRARMEQVIDESVSAGIPELIRESALDTSTMADADIAELRVQMDEARARRLQPHYIERAFREAFTRLGGRIAKREKGRFEITNVPAAVRSGRRDPIATQYERVTFERGREPSNEAEMLAPGHPLHDAVLEETVARLGGDLERGAVLVSPDLDSPRLLVGVLEEIGDATDTTVARRFGYAYVGKEGSVEPAGPAPYLDCVGASAEVAACWAAQLGWARGAEEAAMSWLIANQLPAYLAEVRPRREAELARAREHVESRLKGEAERLVKEAMVADEREKRGERVRETPASLMSKSADIESRLERRLGLIERQEQMAARAPRVVTAALVLPASALETSDGDDSEQPAPLHAVETKEVERRGVDLVLATESGLGRVPVEQPFNNPGFDVLSGEQGGGSIRIEVKARIAGAKDFFITHNEVMTAMNASPDYRLALVRVDPRGPEHDEVRYLDNPFGDYDLGGFQATGIRGDWGSTWDQGLAPF